MTRRPKARGSACLHGSASTLLGLAASLLANPGVAIGAGQTIREARIEIRARAFEPQEVTLRAGAPVNLVFVNHDAELHAFVPERLLDGAHAQVSGSGAPFYDHRGLYRVLMPGGGRTEIRFVPRVPGRYPYRCDLPGHTMVGYLVIEPDAPSTKQRAGLEPDNPGGGTSP